MLKKFFFKNNIQKFSIPFLFLVTSAILLGPFILDLGFYLDDWSAIATYRLQGVEGAKTFYLQDNRPYFVISYNLLFPLLGYDPLAWQIASLFFRCATAVVVWFSFRHLWPKSLKAVTWAALLFLVYPVLKQQPTAVTYIQHWISFFLFTLSILIMIVSVEETRRYWLLTIPGVFLAFLHPLIIEYYIGLELIRPVLLWLMTGKEDHPLRQKIVKVFRYWIPYLISLCLFLVWRFLIMPVGDKDRNAPGTILNLIRDPLHTIMPLLRTSLQDIIEILVSTWHQTLNNDFFTGSTPADLFTRICVYFSALMLGVIFIRFWDTKEGREVQARTCKQFILIGFIALILGFLPSWTVGYHLSSISGMYNDRFGLASTLGASLLLVGLVGFLTIDRRYMSAILAILIALSIGFSLRSSNDYRWSWIKQSRFYWQLSWRIPSVKAQTGIYSDGIPFMYMGTWPISFALNQIYPPQNPESGQMNLWYFDITKFNEEYILDPGEIKASHNSLFFIGPKKNSLAITYEPEQGQCLWVLSSEDVNNRFISERMKLALSIASLDPILLEPNNTPPEDIFGKEPEYDWCYYFEKASLAAQYEQWEEVQRLWKEADVKGLAAQHGMEYLPFIQGLANSGDYETSFELSDRAVEKSPLIVDKLCQAWELIKQGSKSSPERDAVLQTIHNKYQCLLN